MAKKRQPGSRKKPARNPKREPMVPVAPVPLKAGLRSDNPLDDPKDDAFRRDDHARSLAQAILAQPGRESVVIGLYGEWGEGKSTSLTFLRKHLERGSDCRCAPFNPWSFGDEGGMTAGLFEAVAGELQSSTNRKVKALASEVRRYGQAVGTANRRIANLLGVVGMPAAKNVDAALDALTGKTAKAGVELADQKAALAKQLMKVTFRIVVLVDDVDRLDAAEMVSLFRTMRTAADLPGITYVVAMDERVVSGALDQAFPHRAGGGSAFLDKVVQVPLSIPRAPERALRRFLYGRIDDALRYAQLELSEQEASTVREVFSLHLEPLLRTPRAAKKLQNVLGFALELTRNEVDPLDLIVLEALRLAMPSLHDWLRTHRDVVLGHPWDFAGDDEPDNAAAVGRAIDELPRDAQLHARNLLAYLFPSRAKRLQLESTLATWGSVRDRRRRRLSDRAYFDRYFCYGVPEGDVPVGGLRNALRELSAAPATMAQLMEPYFAESGGRPLLREIELEFQHLAPDVAFALGKFLLSRGADLSEQETWLSGSPRRIAAQLAADSIERLPRPTQLGRAQELIAAARPISMATLLFSVIGSRVDRRGYLGGRREDAKDTLVSALGARAKEAAGDEWLAALGFFCANPALQAWASLEGVEATQSYLARHFEIESRLAEFLEMYSESRSTMERDEWWTQVHPEMIRAVEAVCDLQWLREKIRNAYGDLEHVEPDDECRESEQAERRKWIAAWFASRLDERTDRQESVAHEPSTDA